MFRTSISLDAADREALEQFLLATPQEARLATVRALNRASAQARNEISRDLKINLSAADKKRDLTNRRRASRNRLEASIDASDRERNLTRFGGFAETKGRVRVTSAGAMTFLRRANAGGLKVKVYKGQPAVRYPSGFVMRRGGASKGPPAHRAWRGIAKGYTSPYEENRQLQAGVAPGVLVPRLPLIILAGPAVADEFGARIGAFERRAMGLYKRKLTAELDYVLSQRGKPARRRGR
jgi:hypothetical protein